MSESNTLGDGSVADEPRYTREPAVEAQIRRLLGVPRARLSSVALASGGEAAREETLVHIIRRCQAIGDQDNVAALLRGLVGRINAKVARTIAVWRLSSPSSLADEVTDAIIMDFYDQVLTSDESTLFWEIRFWVCLERRLLNIVRSFRRECDRFFEIEDDQDEDDTIEDRQAVTLAWDHEPEMQVLISEALAQLPEDWRTAFLLKHWGGYAVELDGANENETIAAIMGISGRTVRKYLSRAEKRLAAWRIGINNVTQEGSTHD